jgi:hypothetical protein
MERSMLGTKLLSATSDATVTDLGPLAGLPGTWIGSGFSVIPRPDQPGDQPCRLALNQTHETLTFTHVRSSRPDQGSAHHEDLVGVHYRQQIEDAFTRELLHVEPGIWLTVAATAQAQDVEPTVVRLACVPQSDALLAHGTAAAHVEGPPVIPAEDTTPLHSDTQQPATDPRYLLPFAPAQGASADPGCFAVKDIQNPNRLLRAAIGQQRIVRSTVLTVDTTCAGHVPGGERQDIGSVAPSSNPVSMRATLWIEEIERPFESGTFLQLQYTQRVVLRLDGIDWPHVSVATLLKVC